MTSTVELRMPLGYVEVNAEEMEYLDGGRNGWWNSTWFVAGAIDAALYLVPALAAANKATKSGKALRSALAAVKMTKRGMVDGAVKLLRKAGLSVARSTVERAVGAVWAFGGWSIGSIIANGIDMVDCNRNNGYVFG